ncbi:MAG: sigma-70 family RNA polymerase sigma factor [Candidatus Zixiibacteriota bacterium]
MPDAGDHNRNSLSDPRSWVDRHGDILYRFALARVKDRSAAEDLVQETFLAALQARSQFSGLSDEQTWLISILKHKVFDYFRRTSKEAISDTDLDSWTEDPDFRTGSLLPGSWKTGRHPADWAVDPDSTLEAKELRGLLKKCLDDLPSSLFRAFTLREVEEMPPEKVCNVLGVSTTNLRVMMYRARKSLRRCLEIHWLEERRTRKR